MADTQKKDKMSEGMKAEINKQRHEQGQKGIGEYNEDVGGGTPGAKGGRGSMGGNFLVFDDPDDPEAIKAKKAGKKVRYTQPRDDNGQFTYNSANGKGLSTENSRGYTDPPFLAGVDLTFINKGNVLKYEREDGETRRVISTIDMTGQELVNACKVYFKTEGGFLGVIGTGITKKGRETKQEEQTKEGLAGQTDLSTKSENTQKEAQEASENKKTEDLQKQKALSRFKALLKRKNPETQIGTRNGAGVGAGAGSGNDPVDDDDDNDDIPPNDGGDNGDDNNNPPNGSGDSGNNNPPTNNENDFDSNEIETIKNADKQTQANWVRKNASNFKKAIQETGLTTSQIFHLILTGQVKNWDTSTWGK